MLSEGVNSWPKQAARELDRALGRELDEPWRVGDQGERTTSPGESRLDVAEEGSKQAL